MLLERHPDIDAIACASDQSARGVLDTARDIGRRVGRRREKRDVPFIGYDNWDVLALNSRPQLSTIDANLEELGRLAAHQVFDAMDGTDTSAGSKNLPVRLVIRGSTIASR